MTSVFLTHDTACGFKRTWLNSLCITVHLKTGLNCYKQLNAWRISQLSILTWCTIVPYSHNFKQIIKKSLFNKPLLQRKSISTYLNSWRVSSWHLQIIQIIRDTKKYFRKIYIQSSNKFTGDLYEYGWNMNRIHRKRTRKPIRIPKFIAI